MGVRFIVQFNSAFLAYILDENFTLVAPSAWPGPEVPQSSPHHLSHLHIYVQRHRELVKRTQKSNFASTCFMVGNTDKLFLSLAQQFLFLHRVMHSNCGPFQSVAVGIATH